MSSQGISEEEAALYDRQIRLWGLEAQSRIKKAKLLLIGLSPVAGEWLLRTISNNVFYMKDVMWDKCSALKRVRALNEVVNITCEENMSADFLSDKYQNYDEVVIVAEGTLKRWIDYAVKFSSRPCRPKVHCVMSFGMHAVGFADLGCYTYDGDDQMRIRNPKPATNDSFATAPNGNGNRVIDLPISFCTVECPSLKTFFDVSWHGSENAPLPAKRMPKGFYLARLISELDCSISSQNLKEAWPRVAEHLGVPTALLSDDDFESCSGPSLVAISAIIGGIVSQEVIQVLSHKGEPRGNWYFVDGRSCEVTVLWLPKRP
ncbi:SUMO-activating enzyme subunit 1 [Taenia crassiceps]|uniref:SUMO-activating enzyme subunit 1 n=1 Tax=Taenia crassiceps TaxID=6207 RepID=A0ABR4QPY6_9CEST